MPSVYIHKPAKSSTQSGSRKSHKWLMEFIDPPHEYTDALMGWTGTKSTHDQVRLSFDCQEDATAYADRHQLSYILRESPLKKVIPKSYGDNFKATKRP